MKTTKRATPLVLAAAVVWVGCSSACGEHGAKGPDSGITDSRPDRDEASSIQDAAVDAWTAPDGAPPAVMHDFCGQKMFFLEVPEGHTGGGGDIGGGWLAFGWENNYRFQVLRLYDLDQCVEYQVSPEWWYLWGGRSILTVTDKGMVRSATATPDTTDDVYVLWTDSWQLVKLTDTPDITEEGVAFNGRYVAYGVTSYGTGPQDHGFWLMDTDTLESTMLGEPGTSVASYQVSDRYVVWAPLTKDASSDGRDVFYYDLETHDTVQVEASRPGWQSQVDVSGDYIGWLESDVVDDPPYRLGLYRISTGEKTVLTEEPGLFGFSMDNGIVVWATYKYQDRPYQGPVVDAVAYDVRTGVERRLTTRSYPWGAGPGHLSLPWMTLGVLAGPPAPQGVYFANLQLYGIIDDQGNLLPGDPVIEPPAQ